MSEADEASSETARASEEFAPDDEARRLIGLRVMLILGVALAVLMVVFGSRTSENYERYDTYYKATMQDPDQPPAWESEALTVPQCVDEVLDWIEDCPGVSSWCEGALPDVMAQCLASEPREGYCAEVGDAVLTTRFGYDECAERYNEIEEHHMRRYAKKHCALLYRTIAGHCVDTREF